MNLREECAGLESVSPPDRLELKSVLATGPMKRLLGEMLRELDGKKSQIAVIDLTTDEGVRNGLKLQGEIAGMARYLDLMIEGD